MLDSKRLLLWQLLPHIEENNENTQSMSSSSQSCPLHSQTPNNILARSIAFILVTKSFKQHPRLGCSEAPWWAEGLLEPRVRHCCHESLPWPPFENASRSQLRNRHG